jgi:single-strand DNA-binding protein
MLNKTMLIGNLGADVVSRVTTNHVDVANFTVATSERRKDGEGNFQDTTEWHRVVAFDRLAEICSEYLGKGSKVYIEGRLQTRKWVDGEGVTRYTTEIVAREMKMLGDKGDNGPSAPVDRHEPPLPDDVPF